MRYSCNIFIVIVTEALLPILPVEAAVTTYINKSAWQSAIGQHSTITFQGYPEHTLITDQYASMGVLFADGNDRIRFNDSFLNDGVGLRSSDLFYGAITLTFDAPMTAVGADFLGHIGIQLYADSQLIFDSDQFTANQSRFGGLISTIPFDSAIIRDRSDSVVVIDDLFFGPAIPAPSAALLMTIAATIRTRRRS